MFHEETLCFNRKLIKFQLINMTQWVIKPNIWFSIHNNINIKYILFLTIAKSIKESSVAVSSRVDDINKKTRQYLDKNSKSSKIDIKTSNTYNPKSRNQAIKLLEEAKKTAMTNPKATVSKALESIKVDPTYSEAYLIAGFGYKNMYDRTKNQNDKQKAINFFNQYLTLVPNASNKDGVKNIIKTLSK